MRLDAIRREVQRRSVKAVDYMIQDIGNKLKEARSAYYADYSPKVYERTGTLKNSMLQIKPAVYTGSGAKGEISVTEANYRSGSKPSLRDVVDWADAKTHGLYHGGSGVSVWHDPLETMKHAEYMLWHSALSRAGLI